MQTAISVCDVCWLLLWVFQRVYGIRIVYILKEVFEGDFYPIIDSRKIEFISPVVDPASNLREVKVVFRNPDGKIQPGVNGEMILED